MILLHRHRFGVSSYHRRVRPAEAEDGISKGLVISVELRFERWHGGQALQADAFLDPGADETIISSRWVSEQAVATGKAGLVPQTEPYGALREGVVVTIAGESLALGDADRLVWIGDQEDPESPVAMAGLEDMLIGRDFMTQHGLLLVVDGEREMLSLLLPSDDQNRELRDQIVSILDDAAEERESSG